MSLRTDFIFPALKLEPCAVVQSVPQCAIDITVLQQNGIQINCHILPLIVAGSVKYIDLFLSSPYLFFLFLLLYVTVVTVQLT